MWRGREVVKVNCCSCSRDTLNKCTIKPGEVVRVHKTQIAVLAFNILGSEALERETEAMVVMKKWSQQSVEKDTSYLHITSLENIENMSRDVVKDSNCPYMNIIQVTVSHMFIHIGFMPCVAMAELLAGLHSVSLHTRT